MNRPRAKCVAVCLAVASVIVLGTRAEGEGFNPQPEPPGGLWKVEGYIDMWTTAVDPTTAAMPFGIDPAIVSDGAVDFSAGVIARFHAPTTADDKPADGLYDVEFEHFLLRIGDTTWDQTMPGTVQFQVIDGKVGNCSGVVTVTRPEHPDLSLASPGTWQALDERDRENLGIIAGTYSLRDAVVPEPGTLVLLVLGAVSLAWRRRR